MSVVRFIPVALAAWLVLRHLFPAATYRSSVNARATGGTP